MPVKDELQECMFFLKKEYEGSYKWGPAVWS